MLRFLCGAGRVAPLLWRRLLWFMLALALPGGVAWGARLEIDFDAGWKFQLGDPPGAAGVNFDSADWRVLSVPHDWAFEAPYAEDAAQGYRGGYKPGGIGWYRKEFEVSEVDLPRRHRIEFDAVYRHSEVWLNGQLLGRRPSGYISFGYDLNEHLRAGKNLLAVRVDNSREPSARWYHGCGIYGHVRLVTTGRVRIAPFGIFVTTPSVGADEATVSVRTELESFSAAHPSADVRMTVLSPAGAAVARVERRVAIATDGPAIVDASLTVPVPARWSPRTPSLYTLVTEVLAGGDVADRVETRFGIRQVEWKRETGFWLNGENLKIRGVAEHLEAGPVGAAWPDELIRWKIELLKRMGANAIRTAHNPQLPRFYELCDELGMFVLDEIFDGWKEKAPHDYAAEDFATWWERDLRDWLRRDRNHPSVILYSLGNETSGDVATELLRVAKEVDATRLYTSGHAAPKLMDVYGMNGGSESPRFFRNPRPPQPFIATEAPHTWQVRGFYRTKTWFRDGTKGMGNREPFLLDDLTAEEIFTDDWIAPARKANRNQVFNSSYDNSMARITARKNWELARDLPWFSGHFRWTGFDYGGESGFGHGGFPFRAFMGGVIDVAGLPKDHYYFYQSQWTSAPMVHVLPHWTHPRMAPGTKIPVWVYSNAEEVELFLNGKSLGRDRPGRNAEEMQCEWLVPWTPGVIEAIAYRDGQEVARSEQRTAGPPAKLRASVDSVSGFAAGGDSVAWVTIAQTDERGTVYPYGENRLTFRLEGPARLLSLENGNPVDLEPTWGVDSRRAFYGLARAFYQSTTADGPVSVVVGAIAGERRQLTSDVVSIDVQRVFLRGERPKIPSEFVVHYTINGAPPTAASPRYDGPFSVELGSTVRALVLERGREIMRLEESFAPDAGLHWLAPGEPREAPEAGLQAETEKYSGGNIRRKYLDYNGGGYIDLAPGGVVEFYQENDGARGDFRLIFRHARSPENATAASPVFVNDRKVAELPPPPGEVGIWVTHAIEVALQPGGNRIRVQAVDGRVLLDEVRVEQAGESSRRKRP